MPLAAVMVHVKKPSVRRLSVRERTRGRASKRHVVPSQPPGADPCPPLLRELLDRVKMEVPEKPQHVAGRCIRCSRLARGPLVLTVRTPLERARYVLCPACAVEMDWPLPGTVDD